MKYDVYLFEDCRVLKNKLGIKDEAELDKAESEFASISMMGLMDSGFSDFSANGVCAIHKTASDLGIEKRQLITNGYFSKNPERIEKVVSNLENCGVNDLLLSVDAFHQEHIPLDPVLCFAQNAVQAGIPVRLQPAWLVSPKDPNPYNNRTWEIIRKFDPLHISLNQGNVVFPSGNALKYLREYFDENTTVTDPYEEDPKDVRTISFAPDGGVLNGNVYQTDILEMMEQYKP